MSANADIVGGRARLLFIDYLRAAAILYIVGFWHLWEYAPDAPAYQNGFTHAAIFVALGLFVFLSGVLLGRTEVRAEGRSVMSFYRRRLLRIYPLYILALLTFVAFGITNWATAAKSAIGLVMFLGPSPATLWFVAMLVWFYLLAPILIVCAQRGWVFVGVCGALYLGMGLLAWILPDADKRLFIYFPAFAAGIAAGAGLWRPECLILPAAGSTVAVFSLLAFSKGFGLLTVPTEGALALVGPVVLFGLSARNARVFVPNRFVEVVSYASFAMYLFHRPLLNMAKEMFMPQGFLLQWCYLTLLCLPAMVVISWGIQAAYDRLAPARR